MHGEAGGVFNAEACVGAGFAQRFNPTLDGCEGVRRAPGGLVGNNDERGCPS